MRQGRMGMAVAAVAIGAMGLLAAAAAGDPATGTVTIAVGDGKAAKKLKAAGVKVSGAKGARGAGTVTFAVTDLVLGASADAGLSGRLVFTGSGSSASFGGLRLSGSPTGVAITAAQGRKRLTVLTAAGAAQSASGLTLSGAALRLTKPAAGIVRKRLGLRALPTGRIGTIYAAAALDSPPAGPGEPSEPAAGACPTEPVTGAPPFTPPGDLPDAAPLPDLADASALAGGSAVDWGFKASFRGYVSNPGNPGYPAAGTPPILASGGATTNPSGTFHWDGTGEYVRSTVPGSDQVVITGGGAVQFCYPGHGFRITLANPAVVIDPGGDDARIVADVSSELFGDEYPAQRVDLASLDLGGVQPTYSDDGATATWTAVPAAMTADGAAALAGFYPAGTALDPVTVRAKTAAAPDPFADVCPIAAGAGAGPAAVEPAEPVAPLPGAAPVAAGSASWAFKDSFQTYVWLAPPAGTVGPVNGATFSGTSPIPGDFGLPFAAGSYLDAGAPGASAEDAAVVETSGGGLFCKQGHSLRIAFGQVTAVIDGEDSRIVADADANLFGKTQGAQRVTLAELDPTGVTPSEAGGVVTWSNVPATITADGAAALGLTDQYPAGTALEPVTVSVDPQ